MRTRANGILSLALVMAAVGCAKERKLISVDGLASTARVLDFGAISVGTQTKREIDFRDDGRAPVEIASVTTASGRPVFAAEANAQVIRGLGGKAKIVVTFHPEEEGEFGDELVIHTSSQDTPELRVKVTGIGGPAALQFDPPQLAFGGLEVGDARTLAFDVINPTDLPLKITSGAATDFDLSAGSVPPNGRTHMTATFRAAALGHRELTVTATPCETCTAIHLAGNGDALKSALTMSPDPLTWDGVPVHHSAPQTATLKNVSWRTVNVDSVNIDGTEFRVLNGPEGNVLKPGQTADVTLQFAPEHLGVSERTLTVAYHSFATRSGSGRLVGMGGGPQIAVTPTSLQFSDLPSGGKERLQLYVQNAGQVRDLTVTDSSGTILPFTVTLPTPASVAPGAAGMVVQVDFSPTAAGTFDGNVRLHSNDPATPEAVIPVHGTAHAAGPCTFKLTPAQLDFGNVPPGSGAVLGFRFEDTGQTECALKDIQLDPSSDPAFFMPGGSLIGGDLFPTDAFSSEVAFKPSAAGEFHGTLVLTVNDPQHPTARIAIVGHAAESCLVAAPPFIDFGAVRMDCSAHTGSTLVTNACTHPVTVSGVNIGEGTLPEFTLSAAPDAGATFAPGQTFEVSAQYARSALGQEYAPLYVHTQGDPQPLMLPLLAETLHAGQQFDRFTQGSGSQTDVLFVVSNTNTMGPYQARLAAAVDGLLAAARTQGVDLHVGVTSTGLSTTTQAGCYGGGSGGEAGRLVPVDGSAPRIVDLTTAGGAAVLHQSLQAGTCQNLEQGLEAMRLALSAPLIDHADDARTPQVNDGNLGFLRASARLSVVVLSDEDDHSGYDPAVYGQFLRSLKGLGGAHRATFYAIAPKSGSCQTAGPAGDRFRSVVTATGGALYDICEGDYSPFIDQLAQRGIGRQSIFALTAQPDSTGLVVKLDGQPASGSDWYYDTSINAVVFNPGHIPAAGTHVEVDYQSACP
jgi:hypothetical protein